MKKLFSGVLAISIGWIAIAPPILQPTQAQTQSSGQEEFIKLLQQGEQQRQQGKFTDAIALPCINNFTPRNKSLQCLTDTRGLPYNLTA